MLKYLGLISLSALILSCQNTSKDQSIAKDSVKIERAQLQDIDKPSTQESIPKHTSGAITDSIIDALILPGHHRIWENNFTSKSFNKETWEIHKANGKYAIQKAQYTVTNVGEDACSGLEEELIEGKENVIAFFNIDGFKSGSIDSIAFKDKIIEPGKALEFDFKGHKHRLEASGINFHKDEERGNPNTFYALKLYIDNQYIKTILQQSSYNDTATELIFIGDMDRDGLVDFILSSPRDYEEDRLLFILSTFPYAFEGTRQFDC